MRVPLAWLVSAPWLAAAICECGYSAKGPNRDDAPWVFVDQLESDFTTTRDISHDTAWGRQEFNVSAEAGRGKYAKAFVPDNVVAVPNTRERDGSSKEGGGLELRVRSTVTDDAVSVAELDTTRQDLHWGSYRAGIKATDVNGTCSSFFWYFNDTQEIDVEFLSREFDRDKQSFPVNLVIQSRSSMEAGYDAADTGLYKTVDLAFDPTAGFHEYRFDYVPGRVIFYADGQLLAEMNGSEMPSSPGHLILQHWSNGNPLWSGGPPSEDALLTVSYVKAYFNSSDDRRLSDLAKQCAEATSQDGSGPVCVIPDVTAANASSGGSFFTHGGDTIDGSDGAGDSIDTNGSDENNEDNKDSGGASWGLPSDGLLTLGAVVALVWRW